MLFTANDRQINNEHPYIMLADGFMIAHASIDDGVNDVCMSLLRLPDKINVCDYMNIDLILVLATHSPQKHLKALAQLNEFLEFHHGAEQIRLAKIHMKFISYLLVINELKLN